MELKNQFSHITKLIAEAKQRAYQAVNHELCLVADYQTQLPDKKLLQQKWEEILNLFMIR